MDSAETPSSAPARPDALLPGPGILLSRSVIYIAFLLIVAALIWSAVTKLDVIVSAAGRIEVEGEPVKVSVAEAGMIVTVAVGPGDTVESGALLLALDAYKPALDSVAIQAEIDQLLTLAADHRRTVATLRNAVAPIHTEISLAERSVKLIEEQHATFRDLARDRVFSPLEAQEKEKELMEARGRVARLRVDLAGRVAEAERGEQSAREAEGRVGPLLAKMALLRESSKRLEIRSPVAGVVSRMAVSHPGSVIAPSAEAVIILPAGRPLAAVILIPNESMRRIAPGADVRLRVEALPYQDYGFLEGTLSEIEPAPDADGKYRARVALKGTALEGSRGREVIREGLKVEAEIIIERRSVLDFVLKPFRTLAEGRPAVKE